ncbi:MAG: CBS domain-containing protein [Cyanobacteria bacterium J06631_12]
MTIDKSGANERTEDDLVQDDVMDLVLCHTTADFDTLGAAVGVTYLRPGSRIVLAGGVHPTVQRFLSLWRHEYSLIERQAVNFDQVKSLTIVDAHRRDRFEPVADWLQRADKKHLPLSIYDHHCSADATPALASALSEGTFAGWLADWSALFPADVRIETVGAATTLVVEQLQKQPLNLLDTISSAAATIMALGIHSDTGSLRFEQATVRDATALTWLMAQGANQQMIAEYHEPGLSRQLPELLPVALDGVQQEQIREHQLTAQVLMSSPVRTVLPDSSIESARKVLLRYGHTGLCVVDSGGTLVGIVSRRDLDVALRHGLGHAPVTGCMTTQVKTAQPETPIFELHQTMATYDIGRLPVMRASELVGIVTRTDLLRQLKSAPPAAGHRGPSAPPEADRLYQLLRDRLPSIWPALMLIAAITDQKEWSLYLVGGAVRDLLLSLLSGNAYPLTDIDLVVEGAEEGAGVLLAQAIQSTYPQVDIQVHGQFQTAELSWPAAISTGDSSAKLSKSSSTLLVDIATARTEFYPYPAANPEVESSTIRQDLYRRDFTINAMALRLNSDRPGNLLDFFGGWMDLQQRQVRVLHANSFIEDPTRIFRAVRFAVRFDFELDPQTERFIRYAVRSGLYDKALASESKTPALQARLRVELKYVLQASQWAKALVKLDDLGAFRCLHRQLTLTPELERQLRRMDRWLNKFDVDQPRWLMMLLLVIVQLPTSDAVQVARSLQLSDKTLNRVETLHEKEQSLLEQVPALAGTAMRPSQIYRLFHPFERADLLLIANRCPYTLGRWIWQYIVQLSQVPPLVNGATLKRLGYKPGPQFRSILTAVHQLQLDGELTSAQAAEAYVAAQYPRRLQVE